MLDQDNELIENACKNPLLSDNEGQRLVMSLAYSRKDKAFTEKEAFKLVKWAESVRIDNILLDIVLNGKASVDVESEDLESFDDITLKHVDEPLNFSCLDRINNGDRN